MKIIPRTKITDAMFVSSTVAENDAPVWSVGTTYNLNDNVLYEHYVWESQTGGNLGNTPGSDITKWLKVRPSTKWAMFDDSVGTRTVGASPLTVVLNPGFIGGLWLEDVVGQTATITMKDTTGGTVVYTKTIDLDGTIVTSFYDWFFSDYEQVPSTGVTDLPEHYANPEITLTITGPGNVECGVCVVGRVITVGCTQWEPVASVTPYSKKETNKWGVTTLTPGPVAKTTRLRVITKKEDFRGLHRKLSNLDAQLAMWIGTEIPGFEPLTMFGWYKSFDIVVTYPSHHYCNLEIQGMT